MKAEVERHLQVLIRLDTTNLLGKELAAADNQAQDFQTAGSEPMVL